MIHTGWQDFPVGRVIQTQAITITETHIVSWASLTGDWYPLHTDDEYARQTTFGRRVAHGPLTFALAIGLMAQTGVYGDAIQGWLGAQDLRASAPVFIGDTIKVNATVQESRKSRQPDRGVVTLDYTVTNQRGVTVLSVLFSLLMSST